MRKLTQVIIVLWIVKEFNTVINGIKTSNSNRGNHREKINSGKSIGGKSIGEKEHGKSNRGESNRGKATGGKQQG
jgi:hypothetical protein